MSELAYQELGRKLRDARLEHKLELPDAARELHIRARYLEALEDGAFERLPGSTFVTGYLSRYAVFLGLDGAETVESYRKIGVLPPSRLFHVPEALRHEQNPGRQLVIGTLAAAIILATVWVREQTPPPMPPALGIAGPPPPVVAAAPYAPERVLACAEAQAWPPCYYTQHDPYAAMFGRKPVKSVLELRP